MAILSPRYLYNESRVWAGIPNSEEGSFVLWVTRISKGKGCCNEEVWKYIPQDKSSKPKNADSDAKRHRSLDYYRIKNEKQLKYALAMAGPVVVSFKIFKNFHYPKKGRITMPSRAENSIGIHSVALIGYNNNKKEFKLKNSWGTEWGENGYGYLPYGYLDMYMMEAYNSKEKRPLNFLDKYKKQGLHGYIEICFGLSPGFPWVDVEHFIHIENLDTDTLIGWLHYSIKDNFVEIDDLCIVPEFQRKNWGSKLLFNLEEKCLKKHIKEIRMPVRYPDLITVNKQKIGRFLDKHKFYIQRYLDKFNIENWIATKKL